MRQLIIVSWKGGLIEIFRVDNRMPLSIKDAWTKFLMHVMGDTSSLLLCLGTGMCIHSNIFFALECSEDTYIPLYFCS